MNKKRQKNQLNKYVRFSGIAFQMGLTIYLGSVLGKWLDLTLATNNDLFMKICTLFAVFSAMFAVIRQVSNLSK